MHGLEQESGFQKGSEKVNNFGNYFMTRERRLDSFEEEVHEQKPTEFITNVIRNFEKVGCKMCPKLHILHAPLDKFNNMKAYSFEKFF